MDAVARGAEDVDGAERGLELDVLLGRDGMLHPAGDVERAAAAELGMALEVEGRLLAAGGDVGERGDRAVHKLHGDALATLHVNGRPAVRVGQRESVELEGELILSVDGERAVVRRAADVIGVFGVDGRRVDNDVGPLDRVADADDGRRDVDRDRRAVEADIHKTLGRRRGDEGKTENQA